MNRWGTAFTGGAGGGLGELLEGGCRGKRVGDRVLPSGVWIGASLCDKLVGDEVAHLLEVERGVPVGEGGVLAKDYPEVCIKEGVGTAVETTILRGGISGED